MQYVQNPSTLINAIAIKLGRTGFVKFSCISFKHSIRGELNTFLNSHSFDQGFDYKDHLPGDIEVTGGIAELISHPLRTNSKT